MNLQWTKYLLWLAIFIPFINLAQVPLRPEPPRLVNDMANLLNDQEEAILEDSLVMHARQTSNQIVVVTLPSLEGYDPGDMAYRIGESWGVGQKDKNNGIVILVKPKTDRERGQIYISVGYGLEGVIPDAVANGKIIDTEMIPRFRNNDYFGGIMRGASIIMSLSRNEYTAEQYMQGKGNDGGKGGGFVFVIILIIIILSLFKGGNRKSFNSGTRNLPFWLLLGMMGSRGHGGGWSDFSGGRGGFGGGGGGGFGGFGGGSFGGGGAGGSW